MTILNANMVMGYSELAIFGEPQQISLNGISTSVDSPLTRTLVNGVPVSASIEIQSTQSGLYFSGMTTAELAQIVTPAPGLISYDTTYGSLVSYNSALTRFNPIGGLYFASVTLNQAQIQGMYAAPVTIIPAPGAGKAIIINMAHFDYNFVTAAFQNGGNTILQYDTTVHGGGTDSLSAVMANTFINSASTTTYTLFGQSGANLATISNKAITLSNAGGAFTNGNAASTLVVNVWFAVVTTAA